MPYVNKRSEGDSPYGTSPEEGPMMPLLLITFSFALIFIFLMIILLIQRFIRFITSGSAISADDDSYDFDESSLLYDEITESENDLKALQLLSPDEQEIYFQSKEFVKLNKFTKMPLTNWQNDVIKEKGVHAWSFFNDMNNNSNGTSELLIEIQNKSEITFKNKNTPLSVQSNLPIPFTKDVHYIEFKIFDIPPEYRENCILSLGLSTFPYPSFVLPGRYLHSISYDSNGDRRYNMPFPISSLKEGKGLFPKIQEGDVIGIGVRKNARVIFFTRNGKKISESKVGGHCKFPRGVQIHPIIGSMNPCRIDVNFGQLGFVFIEANVKKWGLGPLKGNQIPPPMYKKFNNDILIDYNSDHENDSYLPDFDDVINNQCIRRDAEFTDDDIGEDEFTLNTLVGNHAEDDDMNANGHADVEVDADAVAVADGAMELPDYDNMIEDDIREAMEEEFDEN